MSASSSWTWERKRELHDRESGIGNREPVAAIGRSASSAFVGRPRRASRHCGIAALSWRGRSRQPLAPKDTQPYKSLVYNVAFSYPKSDWVAVPAAGGNIALLMQKKGEASLALDFQVLRVALAPDEIDDTFKEIELEQLTQRAPHARVVSSALNELGGHKVVRDPLRRQRADRRSRRHAVQHRQRRVAVPPDVRGDAARPPPSTPAPATPWRSTLVVGQK